MQDVWWKMERQNAFSRFAYLTLNASANNWAMFVTRHQDFVNLISSFLAKQTGHNLQLLYVFAIATKILDLFLNTF